MQGFKIDFEWTVFADYGVETPLVRAGEIPTLVGASLPSLVAKGRPLTTRPLEAFPDLYLRLAEADPTAAGHKNFAIKYGLLHDREREASFQWEQRVKEMRTLVARVQDQANWIIKNGKFVPYGLPRSFTLSFVPGARPDELTLSIVPMNLFAALVLQCVSHHAGSGRVRACKSCGSLFEIGGTSGRRFHAEFCTPRCRFDFNHRNRRGKL